MYIFSCSSILNLSSSDSPLNDPELLLRLVKQGPGEALLLTIGEVAVVIRIDGRGVTTMTEGGEETQLGLASFGTTDAWKLLQG